MQMIGKVAAFLEAYETDLTYHHQSNGIESLNCVTAGTPEFDTDEEAEKYLADLNTTIKLVRSEYS
jgi:hypothetical protein